MSAKEWPRSMSKVRRCLYCQTLAFEVTYGKAGVYCLECGASLDGEEPPRRLVSNRRHPLGEQHCFVHDCKDTWAGVRPLGTTVRARGHEGGKMIAHLECGCELVAS